jgi:hypothetical protein
MKTTKSLVVFIDEGGHEATISRDLKKTPFYPDNKKLSGQKVKNHRGLLFGR